MNKPHGLKEFVTAKWRQYVTPKVLRWLVVGFVFAAVGLGILKVAVGVLHWPYALASLFSGEVGTIMRYFAVDRWVFGHRQPSWVRLWQYHVANVLGFCIWWGAANLLQLAGVNYLIASILAMFFSVGFNLFSNFLWIWRKPPPAEPGPVERPS